MMETFLPYLAGNFIQTSHSHIIFNPHTGQPVAQTWLCGEEEINTAIRLGLEAEPDMASYPAWKRYEALRFISDELIKNKAYHADLLAREAAKPLRYAITEIERAAQTFLVAAEESKRIQGEVIRLDWTPAGQEKEGIIKKFPLGLIAGISPFNFPLNLAVHKIAPAIASGNPIILKPASSTPLSTLALARIIHQTDLPPGAVSILPASRTAGNQLVTDERIKLLSFTGSDTVGWEMKKQCGKKRIVLELGGNAGVIVSASANITSIIDTCVQGAFAYAGQICIHAQRFFVHTSHYDSFVESLKQQVANIHIGPPEEKDTEFSAMIDHSNAQRVESWINEALADGAELIYGAKRNQNLVYPTILTNTKPTMKVNAEEVFGPVITIEPFREFSEAVHKINQSKFGLQAGVFTNHLDELNYAFEHIHAGGIILNNVPTLRFDHMPYGGVKDSGIGREGVKYAMEDMLEKKILVK
ncbi:MAG: aldehyde dehydrogenase family protein [Flavobacteriales bacterium]|nr:aldehyde dehydrogenase family protein [Flavobacteriales bacterium]